MGRRAKDDGQRCVRCALADWRDDRLLAKFVDGYVDYWRVRLDRTWRRLRHNHWSPWRWELQRDTFAGYQ